MNTNTDGVSAMSAELGLLERLQSLKVLLGTDAPEVRGWAPVVQHGAQATVNATIAALKDINAMSDRLEKTTVKLVEENERLRALAEHLRHCRECGEMDVSACLEGSKLWHDAMHEAA